MVSKYVDLYGQVLPTDLPALHEAITALRTGEAAELTAQFHVLRTDGQARLVQARARAMRDPEGRSTRIAGSLADLTSSHTLDPLTGLPTRQHLVDRLATALESTRSAEAGPMGVLLLDLDHFTGHNDAISTGSHR